ncbi:MAG: dihydroorotase [Candidatus Hydrogenedentes bacterium]|nr:dihydroorotase [Candidatus Hydrogenedentota bacterium]
MSMVIKGGRVVDPASGRSELADVRIENGVVTAIGPKLTGEEVIDATGCVVCPGLVDIHVHFREPGFESKETIRTGSRAAAIGGFTTVVTMANTNPAIDNAGMVEFVNRRARETACIKIRPAACATKGMQGKELTEMAELKEVGVVAVTDDGKDIPNSAVMRRVLEYANMVGLPYLAHCEDHDLSKGGAMNEGRVSTVLGIPAIPKAAEEIALDRNIRLAAITGAHIHIQHVTTAEGIDTIRHFKAKGVRVTCEASPHHFSLTDEAVRDFNANAKMNPPLREQGDIDGIIAGIQDGTVDCIATDHAPHTPTEKEVEFADAPFGIIGLETSLALTLTKLVQPGHITLERAIALMTVEGSKLCNLDAGELKVGGAADICVFNPDEEWTVRVEDFGSRSRNSPFLGERLTGKVKYTLCEGKVVFPLSD